MNRDEHKQFFQKNFNPLYKKLWLDNGKTDADFLYELSNVTNRHCTQTNINRWKSGESVPEVYLTAIGKVLGCTMKDLIGEEVDRIKHFTGGGPREKKRASEMTGLEYRGELLDRICKRIDAYKKDKEHSEDFIEGMREAMRVQYDFDFGELEPEEPCWIS